MDWRPIDGDVIATYQSTCDASRRTGIGRSMISRCINHRALTAGGYLWERVEKCNDYPSDGSTVEDELPPEAQERN